MHVSLAVPLLSRGCHSRLERHKQRAAYRCVIFISFDWFLCWHAATESGEESACSSAVVWREACWNAGQHGRSLWNVSVTAKGWLASSPEAVLLPCRDPWWLEKIVSQTSSYLRLWMWMDESGVICGGSLASFWFQNKSRCLDTEPLPVRSGGMVGVRKDQPW